MMKRAESDAAAWNHPGHIANMTVGMFTPAGAVARELSARRHVLSIPTSEI